MRRQAISARLDRFSRNVKFYNRKAITRVTLLDGVMEVQGIETMTSVPVTDKVAMALAEVPRQGVKSLRAGDKFIAVKQRFTDSCRAPPRRAETVTQITLDPGGEAV